MPDLQKMEAAVAARAKQAYIIKPEGLRRILACIEASEDPAGCSLRIVLGADPETHRQNGFVQVLDRKGGVIATFNDLWMCPPCCPPGCP